MADILLLGSGGREHALAWKISSSTYCDNLYIAPGNAGTSGCGMNVDLDPMDFKAVGDFCIVNDIDILVIGPEAPLVGGIVDYFRETPALQGVYCIGPSADGARLEGSKAFAKEFMARYRIPTASYREFDKATLQDGLDYIRRQALPIVLKADGLAAGKGVLICTTHDEALEGFSEMLGGKFGSAGDKVVIEQFLDGIEFSVFAITDGSGFIVLPVAKDYKRIGEGDTGLNTGGMGSISPVPFLDEELMQKVTTRIIEPTISGISDSGMDYTGFVFFGLINVGGEPFVIEYNCRMGDPETQSVLPRLQNDLVEVFLRMRGGDLSEVEVSLDPRFAVSTVCVSGGYPGSYEKGKRITLPSAEDDTVIFHAGTRDAGDAIVTSGGRVLAATALADTLDAAVTASREMAEKVEFEGKYFRRDIGFDL